MTTHDAINAVFEGGGAIALCLNVRRLLKDKSVKGVSLLTTSWWTAWGFWNVYFYAAVSCAASFWAGLAVVIVNAVWLGLALRYARAERRSAKYAVHVDALVFYSTDEGRTWSDADGELFASRLTDALQDHHGRRAL